MYRAMGCCLLFGLVLSSGCRTGSDDRLPVTAVDNPDPIFGGAGKPKTTQGNNNQPVAGTPTGQQRSQEDRIGPLSFTPKSTAPTQSTTLPGGSPGTASLTNGVKPPQPDKPVDQQVQQMGSVVPASNPAVVEEYRQRMSRFGVAGLRTKALANGTWEAVANLPSTSQPNQMRRIETQGATEADALLAIVEQLEKPQ